MFFCFSLHDFFDVKLTDVFSHSPSSDSLDAISLVTSDVPRMLFMKVLLYSLMRGGVNR